MEDIIDSKHVGTVEGFDIDARLVFDPHSDVNDADCYDAETIAAWKADRWHYVGTVITASHAGIELGSASLWGSEYGDMPGIDGWVNPLDGTGEDFVNGYGPQLIEEAIAEAKAKLAEIAL